MGQLPAGKTECRDSLHDVEAGHPGSSTRVTPATACPAQSAFTLHIEQDSVIKPGSDKDYTMGLILEWREGWVDRSFLARGYRRLDLPGRWMQRRFNTSAPFHSFQLGNSSFTPRKSNLGRTEPVLNDTKRRLA